MKKSKIIIHIIVELTLSIIFLYCLHSFAVNFNNESRNNAKERFNELGTVVANSLTCSVDKYETNLLSISNSLSYIQGLNSQNDYLDKLEMCDSTVAYRIANYRGNMEMVNSFEECNISDTDFFKSAIRGFGTVSIYEETAYEITKRYIVVARPIISSSSDFPTGVVCEFIEPSVLISSLPVNTGASQIIITDNNNVLIGSSSFDLLVDKNMLPLQSIIKDSHFTDSNNILSGNGQVYYYSNRNYSQYVSAYMLPSYNWTLYFSAGADNMRIDTISYTTGITVCVIVYIILSFLSIALFTLPLLKQLNRKKVEESQAMMLANVSHELRTPLNTIIGVSEILSRSELSDGQQKQIAYIADSGKNLLAMINDLLDFSKLNSNKFELTEESYSMEDLIYDTTTVASIRLADKPVEYLVYISSYVPKQLIGDSLRVRQLMTNVISNAVKYTQRGHIVTTIDCEYLSNNEIRLIISVEDTGIGIKKEDIPSVFENYTRFDSYKNKNIEGTGLGMPIARKFARLMRGDITIESVYKKGSNFIINIIQKSVDSEPLLPEFYNSNDEAKKMIILEKSQLLSAHYSLCLEDAYVNFEITDDNYVFSEKISSGEYDFILADPETISMIRDEMDLSEKVTLISLVRTSSNSDIEGNTLFIPLFSLEIHSYLSGRILSPKRHSLGKSLTIYTMPEKRILVVDDNTMNLQVATGIMEPYKMRIDTASSGEIALNLVKGNDYDLIFMDHMMPVMDGEETMKAIKELDNGKYRSIPIIACTANATAGALEMFIKLGFSDFISKPLDIYKLHELIYKWLTPSDDAECIEYKHGEAAVHKDLDSEDNTYIDYKEGLQRIGSMPIYLKTLRNFCDTIPKKKDIIKFSFPNDLKTFVIEVHGLKGVAAIVSANELARQSLTLEMMGKSEDVASIEPLLDDYYKYMMEVKLSAEKFISDHT